MKQHIQSKFSAWIFDSYHTTTEGLALYRIVCALFLLFFGLPARSFYTFLGNLPNDFFLPPPGPFMAFSGFPAEYVFLIVHYLLIAALICLLLGVATKWASISVAIFLFILKGFIYSLGKINHDIVLILIPLIMAFSGWGKAYSIDSLHRNKKAAQSQSWVLVLLALCLGFMMFTAGFPKILGGWLDIQTHASQMHYLNQFLVGGRQDLIAPLAWNFNGIFWEISDYVTVLFEVGFLAAIITARTTRIFICLAVLFHFSTMMILNIAFLPNFLVYAAFLNWGWIDSFFKKYHSYLPVLAVIFVMLFMYGLTEILGGVISFQSDLTIAAVCWITIGVIIAFYHLIKQTIIFLKSRSTE